MKYTKEQEAVIEQVLNNPVTPNEYGNITLVPAGAGCGKTFIGGEIISQLNPTKGLYTAFNKAIVEEGAEKFKNYNVECKTFHALAYKYVRPTKGVQELSYGCIKEDISYKDKAKVLEVINSFFVSDSTDMEVYFNVNFEDEYLASLAEDYVSSMVNEVIPMSFNFMLKYLHLMLVEGATCAYDIVILDEINDVTAVQLEIFKYIKSPIKLGLGESHQAIYKFLNLKDGFVELPKAKQLPLTNSFRCSKPIARSIQTFMQTHADINFTFTGTDEPCENGDTLYVTMTNAAIIFLIKDRLSRNKGFTLLRKISEIFAYPMALVTASSGKEVYQHKYKFLEKEYRKYTKNYTRRMSFFSYLLQEVGDDETKSAISLLSSLALNNTNIFELYSEAKLAKADPKVVIATAFTAKGLEFETVHVNGDLNNAVTRIIEGGGVQSEDDLVTMRVYYVATSRAGTNLINATHLGLHQ
jgi:superfamily I DNA/RNA helicase